jgi:glycosyltransferase involved in cell wall biosynthesis
MGALIEVFNRYNELGGEEVIADAILCALREHYTVESVRFNSSDWKEGGAPGKPWQVLKMFHNCESSKSIADIVQTRKIDAIFCHNIYPVASPSVYRIAKYLGIPVVQFIHNFRPFSVNGTLWAGGRVTSESLTGNFLPEIRSSAWQGSIVKSAIMAAVLRSQKISGAHDSVKCWIAISDFMKQKFIEAGVPKKKVVTLRHFWEPTREGFDCCDQGYYMYLGRLVPEKGVQVIVEAWRLLQLQFGKNCPRLVIAGAGELAQLVTDAAEANPAIEYYGFVEGAKKQRLLRGARAVLAPSIWWEPLGLVTYEAYEYYKPMVAAASGGLCETVKHHRTGLLHQPDDPASLAASILEMESMSQDERKKLGIRGHEWLLREASKQRWCKCFKQIIATLNCTAGPFA